MVKLSDNLRDVLKKGSIFLKDKGVSNAQKELEWFCEKKLQYSLTDIHVNDIFLSANEIKILQNFIERRIKKEPFQYIINSAPFLEYDFYVNSHVLIPRPETEIIFKILKNRFFKTALDVGTGSGNIAISLKLKNLAESITAIDCEPQSLEVAKLNAKFLDAQNIDFLKADIFNHQFFTSYDLVVSNPPYISKKDYHFLSDSIKNYEPSIALTDHHEGYRFYQYFAENISSILKPQGTMILEIGLEKTKSKIEKLFENQANLIWHKDYNHDYRILEINA
jgi:release factor glutamine methyltransferase